MANTAQSQIGSAASRGRCRFRAQPWPRRRAWYAEVFKGGMGRKVLWDGKFYGCLCLGERLVRSGLAGEHRKLLMGNLLLGTLL